MGTSVPCPPTENPRSTHRQAGRRRWAPHRFPSSFPGRPRHIGRGSTPMPDHPITSGFFVGVIEISITYPMELVKRQMQLQQQASHLVQRAGASQVELYQSPMHCAASTVRQHGVRGLYRGFDGWVVFAGPRHATRFAVYEASTAALNRLGLLSDGGEQRLALADTACGFVSGVAEAALVQTPNQAVSIKMLHDQSPSGLQRYRGMSFFRVARAIHAEHGFVGGFYCGVGPAVLKGASTNCIRFPVFGALKRWLQRDEPGAEPRPLPMAQSMLAGALAGAVSAVATHPIDTVMGNMQGLESGRYQSGWECLCAIVRAGGVRALYFGLGTRVVRVVVEMALTFTLYERVSPVVDRVLAAA